MRLEIQLAAAAVGYVGVELRRGQIRVSEHLLNGAQVGAALEQVGGEGVAEQVGVDAARLEARLVRELAQDQEGAGAGERAALGVEEELGRWRLSRYGRPRAR